MVNGSSWCGSPVTPVTGCCIDPSVAPRRPFVRRRVGEAGEPSLRGLGSFWVREKHRLFVLVWRSLVWRSHLLRARWFCVYFVARFSVPLEAHWTSTRPMQEVVVMFCSVASLGLLAHLLRRWLDPPGTHPNHRTSGGGWSPRAFIFCLSFGSYSLSLSITLERGESVPPGHQMLCLLWSVFDSWSSWIPPKTAVPCLFLVLGAECLHRLLRIRAEPERSQAVEAWQAGVHHAQAREWGRSLPDTCGLVVVSFRCSTFTGA